MWEVSYTVNLRYPQLLAGIRDVLQSLPLSRISFPLSRWLQTLFVWWIVNCEAFGLRSPETCMPEVVKQDLRGGIEKKVGIVGPGWTADIRVEQHLFYKPFSEWTLRPAISMRLQLDKKYGGSANTMSIELSSNCSIRDKLTPLYKLKHLLWVRLLHVSLRVIVRL